MHLPPHNGDLPLPLKESHAVIEQGLGSERPSEYDNRHRQHAENTLARIPVRVLTE